MKFDELYNIIKNLKHVDVYNFKFLTLFKYAHAAGIECSSEWCGRLEKEWSTSKPNITKQTAFEDCVKADMYTTPTGIEIKLTIYDGDSLTGERLGASCTYTLLITEDNYEALLSSPITMSNNKHIIEWVVSKELYYLAKCEVERKEIERIQNLVDVAYKGLILKFSTE
jgi:hypothetical protein